MTDTIKADPRQAATPPPASRDRRRITLLLVGSGISALTFGGIVVAFLTLDLGDRAVPGVSGHPRALDPLWGFDYWPYLFEMLAVVAFVVIATIVVTNSILRRRPTIGAIFFVASLMVYWMDPWGNWAPYAIYDPRLLHWPVSWPWAAVAPNIEPVFGMVGYFTFYLGPPLAAVWILKSVILPRTKSTSLVHRHPLITLTVVAIVVGFVLDAIVELLMIRTGLYAYSQVMPFGSIFVGTPYQFPLLWESLMTTIPFVFTALLWWRDDTGQTYAERLTSRWGAFRRMGALGTLLIVFTGICAGYALYLVPYIVIHKTGAATGTAQPYRYCEMAVPDPNGQMKLNGQPGPYVAGWWPGPYNTESSRVGPLPANACPQ